MRQVCLPIVFALGWMGHGLAQGAVPVSSKGPGYNGTMATDLGRAALRSLFDTVWEDKGKRLGGGDWKIEYGGVTPHPFGPGRGDVIELRSVHIKGPHIVLRQGRKALFLPARSDGDVAAIFKFLGHDEPAGMKGSTTAPFDEAMARLNSMGEAVRGISVGVYCSTSKPGQVRVFAWNASDIEASWIGRAELRIDGKSVPVELRWMPQLKAPVGASRLHLESGSAHEIKIDVPQLKKPGKYEVQVVLLPIGKRKPAEAGKGEDVAQRPTKGDKPNEPCSRKVTVTVPER